EVRADDAAPAQGVLEIAESRWPAALDPHALEAILPGVRVAWTGRGAGAVLRAPASTWRGMAARACAAEADRARPLPIDRLVSHPGVWEDALDPAERVLYAEAIVR